MKSFENGKLKAVTFSYDDGVVQDVRFIELLKKYNLKCTFNINSELLGTGKFITGAGQRILHYKINPEDLKLVYSGHEVAVHTLTHPNLTKCDESEIIRQVENDRKNLENLVSYDVIGMAYPCGNINNNDYVAEIIKNNSKIKYCRTITSSYSFDVQENLYRFNPTVYHLEWDKMFELGEKFVKLTSNSPQIFYIWGHTYEFDYDTSYWMRMEEFFKLISNRDDIFYGTNREVLLG